MKLFINCVKTIISVVTNRDNAFNDIGNPIILNLLNLYYIFNETKQ